MEPLKVTPVSRARFVRVPALLAALVLLLVACGGGTDETGDTAGDEQETQDGNGTEDSAAAGDEDLGTLTMYTHNDESEMQSLAPAAEEALSMYIQFIRLSSGDAMSRILGEAPNIGADMMWGMTHSNALQLADEGLLHSYVSDEWSDVEQEFWDPEGQWYGWSYWFNIIGVNTDLVDDLGLDTPESWDDLTDPQYEGEIVMPDPRESGTAYLIIAAIMQMMDEDEAWEYLEALDANVSHYEGSGGGPADLVAQGEYAIAVTWDQAVFDYVVEGFPMAAVIPEEGVGFDLDTAFIFEDADNVEAAEALVDWLGTVEGQE